MFLSRDSWFIVIKHNDWYLVVHWVVGFHESPNRAPQATHVSMYCANLHGLRSKLRKPFFLHCGQGLVEVLRSVRQSSASVGDFPYFGSRMRFLRSSGVCIHLSKKASSLNVSSSIG